MNSFLIRCDGINDCPDASDELNCHKIVVSPSYQNEVPISIEKGKQLANIYLSIDVVQVLELVEVESLMRLKYRMTLQWTDSKVTFRNLKEDSFLNAVGNDDAAKIWYPQVVFYNTEDVEETKVKKLRFPIKDNQFIIYFKYNDKSVITVKRMGNPTVSSMKELQNDHTRSFFYKGWLIRDDIWN